MNTRPSQLMPTDEIAIKSVQSLLSVVGSYEGNIDGKFETQSIAAYNALREQYSFLPDIGESLDASELPLILNAIDDGLQNNVAFQQAYVSGVSAETNATELQGTLIAGGAWANRHLGDRISDAEMLEMDGNKGILTDRALRNSIKTTGISGMQASLNLLGEDTKS